MAKYVHFRSLKHPHLLAARTVEQTLSRGEIAKLIAGYKVYSKTKDGEVVYFWTEEVEKKKRRKNKTSMRKE